MVRNYMSSRRTLYLEGFKLLIKFLKNIEESSQNGLETFFVISDILRTWGRQTIAKQLQFHNIFKNNPRMQLLSDWQNQLHWGRLLCILMEVSGHDAVKQYHDSKLVSLIIWAKKLNSFGWPAIKQVMFSSVLFLKNSFVFSACIHDLLDYLKGYFQESWKE